MFSLSKILVPVDFSERSTGASRCAEALARRFGAEVILLHVLPPPHYEFSALEVGGTVFNELFAARARQVRKDLDEFAEGGLAGLNVRRVLLEGGPARKIVEFAHQEGVSAIIMPTHGYGVFRRFILGSTTAKVLHDADCPVWTGVHLEQTPEVEVIRFERVLAAIDLGPQSQKTLEWAAGLASNYGARLHVVHALPCVAVGGEGAPAEFRERLTGQARDRAGQLLASAGIRDAELSVQTGDPPMLVCDTAGRLQADVLVIGRGSAAGVFGRLRTNAYAIIRQSPCPVVSV